MPPKPDMTAQWGSDDANTTDPGNAKINLGWVLNEQPPSGVANFVDKRQDQFLAHINEEGLPVWDAVTNYPINAYVKGSDGEIYKSLTANQNNDPVSSPTEWEVFGGSGGTIPDASESQKGIIQLATQAETDAGTDDTKAITPLKLANGVTNFLPDASESQKGVAEIATQAETDAGTDDEKFITPLKLANGVTNFLPDASESQKGVAEIATQAETDAGTDDEKFITPEKLLNASIPATTTTPGRIAFATQAETDAGLINNKAITPQTLANSPGNVAGDVYVWGGNVAKNLPLPLTGNIDGTNIGNMAASNSPNFELNWSFVIDTTLPALNWNVILIEAVSRPRADGSTGGRPLGFSNINLVVDFNNMTLRGLTIVTRGRENTLCGWYRFIDTILPGVNTYAGILESSGTNFLTPTITIDGTAKVLVDLPYQHAGQVNWDDDQHAVYTLRRLA